MKISSMIVLSLLAISSFFNYAAEDNTLEKQLWQQEQLVIELEQQVIQLENEASIKKLPTHFDKPTLLAPELYDLALSLLETRYKYCTAQIETCELQQDIWLANVAKLLSKQSKSRSESSFKKPLSTGDNINEQKRQLILPINQILIDVKNIRQYQKRKTI